MVHTLNMSVTVTSVAKRSGCSSQTPICRNLLESCCMNCMQLKQINEYLIYQQFKRYYWQSWIFCSHFHFIDFLENHCGMSCVPSAPLLLWALFLLDGK